MMDFPGNSTFVKTGFFREKMVIQQNPEQHCKVYFWNTVLLEIVLLGVYIYVLWCKIENESVQLGVYVM